MMTALSASCHPSGGGKDATAIFLCDKGGSIGVRDSPAKPALHMTDRIPDSDKPSLFEVFPHGDDEPSSQNLDMEPAFRGFNWLHEGQGEQHAFFLRLPRPS